MTADALMAALHQEGGLGTVQDLAAATGLTPRTIRARASRAGCWQPFPGVLGLPLAGPDRRDWMRAAVLHAAGRTGDPRRDLVAITRLSALHLLGTRDSTPTRVHLVVPRQRAVRPHARIDVTRSAYLRLDEVTRKERMPVVRGAALLRDLAAVRDVDRLRADAIGLLHRGWCSVEDLQALLARDRGFTGRERLARVATELASAGRVDSVLELQARRQFAADGIHFDRGQVAVPAPRGRPNARPIHLDLGILAIRFGIEVDSVAFHSSPVALRRDAARSNRVAAQLDDWRVLRLTWEDLRNGWQDFIALTRQVMRDQSQRCLGRDWPRRSDLRLG